MSKKNTPVKDKKQNETSNQVTDLKKANPTAKPAPVESAETPESKEAKEAPVASEETKETTESKEATPQPPTPEKEAPQALSPQDEVIALISKEEAFPKAWSDSFAKRIKSAKASHADRLRDDFRTAAIESHEKSAEIADVFQTERKESRQYHFLLSLAANSSGFDGKVREKLSDATLKGNREEFMDLLIAAIYADQPNWGKIDESISNLV